MRERYAPATDEARVSLALTDGAPGGAARPAVPTGTESDATTVTRRASRRGRTATLSAVLATGPQPDWLRTDIAVRLEAGHDL